MIVGADDADDAAILDTSATLYASYGLKRVYYSAFSPIPEASPALPVTAPPLQREHRLYQADWLMRFYGFAASEMLAGAEDGMLDLAIDPKLAWALRHRERFPVDVNRADRAMLLRVPGLGARSVGRILAARRHRTLRLEDLGRLATSVKKLRPFVIAANHRPSRMLDRLDPSPIARAARAALPLCLNPVYDSAIARPDDFAQFRDVARRLIAAGAAPASVLWHEGEDRQLFGAPLSSCAAPVSVPGAFVRLAEDVNCHRDGERFTLLYQALWRLLHGERQLLQDAADPLVHRLTHMARAVIRDLHRMHAFVRFRRLETEDGERLVRAGPPHPAPRRAFLRRPLRRHALVDPHARRFAALERA
jgi:hypothetical protein